MVTTEATVTTGFRVTPAAFLRRPSGHKAPTERRDPRLGDKSLRCGEWMLKRFVLLKGVCRDFAVLEDHTLAHSLQEQEIEHHLASNVQRNRLVQHDLQVAKQLQEEDLKAQAQLQKRYKDLEQQDCEIAQEIQEKLAIEAEKRRIQEKKDEDIARLLQEKELQEEKKRKKHFPESSGGKAYGDSYYYEDGDQPRSRRARELGSGASRPCRLQSDGKTAKQRKEESRHPQENLEEPEEPCSSERSLSSSSSGRARDNPQMNPEQRDKSQPGHERQRRPPLPRVSGEVFLSTEQDDWEANHSRQTRNWEKKSRHQDHLSPESSQKAGLHCKEAVCGRGRGRGEHRGRKRRPRTPPFSQSEERLPLHDTVGVLKCRYQATQVDMRAAQVAQDEEIARLLMAEEKKAYKKAREREKSSLDKRKHDPEWKANREASASGHEPSWLYRALPAGEQRACACSPKQLNQHTRSQKRAMNLTVLRMTGQHGKMTPEKESEELAFGVRSCWFREACVCFGEEIKKSAS
ncbi:hypothetical protein CB1_001118045 [Camelus ferus]|nr:hypothetical protein CB1_001118045 [Camelus ferus]